MIFNSKEELLTQAKKDGACSRGLEWAIQKESLKELIDTIPRKYRFWCIFRGYEQFTEHCSWKDLEN
jgi:hypothetical protein